MAKIKPLRQNPLFTGFSDREIAILSQIVDEGEVPAGQEFVLHRHGLVILKSGGLEIQLQELKSRVEAGDSLGELALIAGSHAPADLQLKVFSIDHSEYLFVSNEKFLQLFPDEPEVCARVMTSVSQRLAERSRDHMQVVSKLLAEKVSSV